MKNLTILSLSVILFVLTFITVNVAKTQIIVLEAEILFIAASIASYMSIIKNKKNLQPIPVKVKAHRKF